jgi:hypothetical protein
VYADLTGLATLASMEESFELRIAASRLGQLTVTGRIRDGRSHSNELSFGIEGLDRTDLPAALASLDRIVASFPAIHDPTGRED